MVQPVMHKSNAWVVSICIPLHLHKPKKQAQISKPVVSFWKVIDRRVADASFAMLATANSSSSAPPSHYAQHKSAVLHVFPQAKSALPDILSDSATKISVFKTNLSHIVFGIAASAKLWEKRKHYIKAWWMPKMMRGFVWLDQMVVQNASEGLPPLKLSADTAQFKYTHKKGNRAAIRISRVVSETYRIRLPDVQWFVMGDDDTVFIPENLVSVLSKYNPEKFYYIGSSSESHTQNIEFSYNMAYGGGGFAVSYPLAKALEKIQDSCLQRYTYLFGSDDRIQACMAELGVPLTKEPGFHQFDIYGDAFGLLTAHPLTPFISLHHLDYINPIFPNMARLQALQRLLRSGRIDPGGLLQQSFCYDKKQSWSFSISWGYAIQLHQGLIPPRELERATRTFVSWYKKSAETEYTLSTRPAFADDCTQSAAYYIKEISFKNHFSIGNYTQEVGLKGQCKLKMAFLNGVESINVVREKFEELWHQAPRRQCCKVLKINNSSMQLHIGACQTKQIINTL
ncbi:hypothetical protein O6H91_14G059500 [Diphasiastrum complanatum]|uniref:Uncharacterized protein n=1 Tax=Diphasiastrum complanatum TaxID=34168 RepID=A0ACC2BPU3_DIPCM|nr:hypothetical protein O6H91_14G059500 [Diphasiastrum complanatum]